MNNEYTRNATVVICLYQAVMWLQLVMRPEGGGQSALGLAVEGYGGFFYFLSSVVTRTAGTVFLMWLGEQIDEYGIGNGISLIIMAGICARIPEATGQLLFERGKLRKSIFRLGGETGHDISFEKLLMLIFLFIIVVVGVIAITKGQRRIPTQSAKHVRGRRVYGGTRQFLPLKVNQAGVMPVIFASSLLIIPGFIFGQIAQHGGDWAGDLGSNLQRGSGRLYNTPYI